MDEAQGIQEKIQFDSFGSGRKMESDEVLGVHHIDYDKENTVFENYIALCRSCNAKVNKDREYWVEYFVNLVKEKYEISVIA